MLKEEIVGAVLLKISGGEPGSDLSVWVSDIDSLLAPAVNYVQTKQYFIDKREEDGDKIIQHFMLQTFGANREITIQTDAIRKRKYFTLPKRPLSLSNGRALQFVGSVLGVAWIPLAQGAEDMQVYYEKYKGQQTSYRPEGLNVYLWNLGPLVENAMVRMLVNVQDLADTDEIMLPSGGEIEVIQLMYEWISGQRAMPKDVVVDQKDRVKE